MKGDCIMENVGTIDRYVRGLMGLLMLVVFFHSVEMRGMGLAGTLLMITAVLSYCPFYVMIGLNTREGLRLQRLSKRRSTELSRS